MFDVNTELGFGLSMQFFCGFYIVFIKIVIYSYRLELENISGYKCLSFGAYLLFIRKNFLYEKAAVSFNLRENVLEKSVNWMLTKG